MRGVGRSLAVASALLPLLAACRSVQPVPLNFIAETKPAVVYLSNQYGVTREVWNPRVSGDTILGMTGGNKEIAVPLSQVERVAAERPNRAHTVLLVGGIAVFAGLMTYTVVTKAFGDGSQFCDYDRQPVNGDAECGYASSP
jgi:hypothetical protein